MSVPEHKKEGRESEQPGCPLCGSGDTDHLLGPVSRRFASCRECGLLSLAPPERLRPEEERARYLLHNNDPSDAGYRRYLQEFTEAVCEFLDSCGAGLDYGSGPVDVLAQMLREQGYAVSAWDPIFASEAALLSGQYDFVLCHEVMEHFFQPAAAFEAIDRLLAEGAVLAVRTGILRPEIAFDEWWYARDPSHCSFYRTQTMEWLARSMSWNIVYADSEVGIYVYRKLRLAAPSVVSEQ